LLPKDWQSIQPGDDRPLEARDVPRGNRLWKAISEIQPSRPLPQNVARGLRDELDALRRPVAEARKLAEMPSGQTSFTLAKNPIEIQLPYEQASRKVVRLLQLDAFRRVHEGDADGAVASILAVVNVSRSIGDAPFLISQIVRMAVDSAALSILKRVLLQSTPSERALKRLQDVFEREESEPRLVTGLSGERAMRFDLLGKLDSGELQFKDLDREQRWNLEARIPPDFLSRGYVRHNQALGLKLDNQSLEIARRPLETQKPLWDEFEAQFNYKNKPTAETLWNSLAYATQTAVWTAAPSETRVVCELRCARVGIACVRYKQATGRWPGSIEALVPRYLKAKPVDPFDGATIRYRSVPTGVIIYGVGIDRKDDGGRFASKPAPGYDLGLELSDVKKGVGRPARSTPKG
jgi:hypothetical protein